MVLNNVQRQIGADNYSDAVRISRRQMLTGALVVPTAAGAYWGYDKLEGKPIGVGVIGTGDQGNAHISSMNPDYCQVVAFSDIRPSSVARTRTALLEKFPATASEIKYYEDYNELLKDPVVEMVIIALPLHLHHAATIAALRAGKHVLCEKLMAKTVAECKEMIRVADETKKMLAIGHQRHYSYLYANCRSVIEQGSVLGDVRHIRALWHRNQTVKRVDGQPPIPGAPGAEMGDFDGWAKLRKIFDEDKAVDLKKYGYDSLEQLVRWRLSEKTGAGLVAELGSHQLDACSIFLGKVHPKSVQGSGVTSFFKDNRQVEDHVFLIFEYGEKANNAVVTYTSIGTNAFDGYGEQVMGTKGTLIVQEERDAYVFREGVEKDTRITWAEDRVSRPTTASSSTTQWAAGAATPDTLSSRGYREEQEHMAWLIRQGDKIVHPSRENPHPENDPATAQFVPRCHGRVALADAVIALCSNLAMRSKQRIEFKEEWFDPYSELVPENEIKTA
jgi:predicted dehydrogenase